MESHFFHIQKGFTLIELMIVVSIIGILASVAIPSYKEYVARSQLSEAVNLVSGLKVSVSEVYSQTGICPSNITGSSTAYSIPIESTITGKYVAKVTTGGPAVTTSTGDCTITATMKGSNISSDLQNATLTYTMNFNGATAWLCTSTAQQKYLPPSCTSSP